MTAMTDMDRPFGAVPSRHGVATKRALLREFGIERRQLKSLSGGHYRLVCSIPDSVREEIGRAVAVRLAAAVGPLGLDSIVTRVAKAVAVRIRVNVQGEVAGMARPEVVEGMDLFRQPRHRPAPDAKVLKRIEHRGEQYALVVHMKAEGRIKPRRKEIEDLLGAMAAAKRGQWPAKAARKEVLVKR